MNLALKYRPKTFSEVVGQNAISAILNAMIRKGILSNALLFTGPSGVGKTSMARIVAAALNESTAEDVHEGLHPSILEIDAASSGSVAAMRDLKHSLNYATLGHRVVILDECHAISDEGKAVLLNLLESLPSNVTFILLTTESHKIPVQVRHRCDEYSFKKASVPDLFKKLQDVCDKESIILDSDLLIMIAERSEGSFRESMMLLKQVWASGVTSIEQYVALHGEHDCGPKLLESGLQGPSAGVAALQEALWMLDSSQITDSLISTLGDLLLLNRNHVINLSGSALDVRKDLAMRLDQGKILKCLRILWDLQTKLVGTDPARGLLMAFSMICETIATTASAQLATQSITAHTASVKAPMTLEQMRQRAN